MNLCLCVFFTALHWALPYLSYDQHSDRVSGYDNRNIDVVLCVAFVVRNNYLATNVNVKCVLVMYPRSQPPMTTVNTSRRTILIYFITNQVLLRLRVPSRLGLYGSTPTGPTHRFRAKTACC